MPIVKILYVDSGVDEKLGSSVLETATKSLDIVCVFTIVKNNFLAFESTEHCSYDLIIITEDSSDFSIIEMMELLGKLCIHIPVILIYSKDQRFIQRSRCGKELVQLVHLLEYPFSSAQLCDSIIKALRRSQIDLNQNRKRMNDVGVKDWFSTTPIVKAGIDENEIDYGNNNNNGTEGEKKMKKRRKSKTVAHSECAYGDAEFSNKDEESATTDGNNEDRDDILDNFADLLDLYKIELNTDKKNEVDNSTNPVERLPKQLCSS